MKVGMLRGVGLALIAAPEPFSTPVGVGLLAASWLIQKSQESRKKARVRQIVTEYLHAYRPFGHGAFSDSETYVQHHAWQRDLSLEKTRAEAFRSETGRPGPSGWGWGGEVVHHAFDWDLVVKRVDNGGQRRKFEGYWGARTRLDVKVVHHELRRDFALAAVN